MITVKGIPFSPDSNDNHTMMCLAKVDLAGQVDASQEHLMQELTVLLSPVL